MATDIAKVESAYCDAAAELRSKQVSLQNHADELHKFIGLRGELQGHSDFSGYLPETYFSGGELDPIGSSPKSRASRSRP